MQFFEFIVVRPYMRVGTDQFPGMLRNQSVVPQCSRPKQSLSGRTVVSLLVAEESALETA